MAVIGSVDRMFGIDGILGFDYMSWHFRRRHNFELEFTELPLEVCDGLFQ